MRSLFAAAVLLAGIAAPALAEDVPPGAYGCWTHTMHRADVSFTVSGPGSYTDSQGRGGTFKLDGNRIRFSGGLLDKRSAIFTAGNTPSVSLLEPSGAEAAYCPRS